jgi:hypothetical protein
MSLVLIGVEGAIYVIAAVLEALRRGDWKRGKASSLKLRAAVPALFFADRYGKCLQTLWFWYREKAYIL